MFLKMEAAWNEMQSVYEYEVVTVSSRQWLLVSMDTQDLPSEYSETTHKHPKLLANTWMLWKAFSLHFLNQTLLEPLSSLNFNFYKVLKIFLIKILL